MTRASCMPIQVVVVVLGDPTGDLEDQGDREDLGDLGGWGSSGGGSSSGGGGKIDLVYTVHEQGRGLYCSLGRSSLPSSEASCSMYACGGCLHSTA